MSLPYHLAAAEQMAMAVLRGDTGAARQLADYLCEEYSRGAVEIPPLRKICTEVGRLRIAVYVTEERLNPKLTREVATAVTQWVNGGDVLILPAGYRLELYEMP